MFPFSVSRNQEPAHPGGTIPSTFRSQGLVTFSAVYFSRILPRVFHLRTLMGFTLQSVPFREMLGSSRSRIPSCRYPSPSAVRGRSCLFPGRQDRTSRLQGFDPSRSPFTGARGLAKASGRCSPGFMPLQGFSPGYKVRSPFGSVPLLRFLPGPLVPAVTLASFSWSVWNRGYQSAGPSLRSLRFWGRGG